MIPIYLKKTTIDCLNGGKIYLKRTSAKLSIDDFLMYKIAKRDYLIDKEYKIKKGDKVVVSYEKNKEVDYNDVLSNMNDKEQVFFLLYNSINYVNEKFGISTYLNEDLSYMLAYLPEEEYSKYGRFITKAERKQFEADYGYDKVLAKTGTSLGTFEFHTQGLYAMLHRQAINIKNNPKIKEANKKLVEYFIGDVEYIKQLAMKTTVDIMQNSRNEAIKLKATEQIGKWTKMEENTQNTQLNVILDSITTAEALREDKDEF